ncbi:hypothetical protein BFG06_03010 [Aeromonas caviae]|nr:hypothetical protein BFG06_03010 [Aeromonas caviae]
MRKYDEANPLFGQRADASEFALNGTFFWHNLFGIKPLAATFTAAYSSADSDIDFYDAEALRFSTGRGTGWDSGCWCAITASGAIPCCTRSSLTPARSVGPMNIIASRCLLEPPDCAKP